MNKKLITIIISVIMLLALVFPIRTVFKDGGSVQYKSLTYTIINYHKLSEDTENGYADGLGIKVLGVTIKDIENGYL